MNITRILITPEAAKTWLSRDNKNRRISQPVVLRYAADMAAGRWKEDTGELIKISKSGRVLDGQHRLTALIKANTYIYFHVALGLDDTVFDVLDTGKSRNASDVFKIAQVNNGNSIPSIIAQYNLLRNGNKFGVQIHNKATNAELLDQYYNDEELWQEVARKSYNWYCSFAKILTPSFIGGFYAYLRELDDEKAEQFMNQLTTGINIENQTISILRSKLMQDKMSPRKMPVNLKLALVIKAWNHFIDGKEVKLLKFDSFRDEFPTAKSTHNGIL